MDTLLRIVTEQCLDGSLILTDQMVDYLIEVVHLMNQMEESTTKNKSSNHQYTGAWVDRFTTKPYTGAWVDRFSTKPYTGEWIDRFATKPYTGDWLDYLTKLKEECDSMHDTQEDESDDSTESSCELGTGRFEFTNDMLSTIKNLNHKPLIEHLENHTFKMGGLTIYDPSLDNTVILILAECITTTMQQKVDQLKENTNGLVKKMNNGDDIDDLFLNNKPNRIIIVTDEQCEENAHVIANNDEYNIEIVCVS